MPSRVKYTPIGPKYGEHLLPPFGVLFLPLPRASVSVKYTTAAAAAAAAAAVHYKQQLLPSPCRVRVHTAKLWEKKEKKTDGGDSHTPPSFLHTFPSHVPQELSTAAAPAETTASKQQQTQHLRQHTTPTAAQNIHSSSSSSSSSSSRCERYL